MNGQYREGDIVFGSWKLVRKIGEGSFGKVYEAEREGYGLIDKAAIKILTIPHNAGEIDSAKSEGMDEMSISAYFEGMVKEIVQEFALMSKLKGNSNVVSCEDYVVIDHQEQLGWDIMIRMELLTPLNKLLLQAPLSVSEVIKLGIDMCKALELCQKYSIIHRDIKPENIFISDLGEYKLGDFGIARTFERTSGVLSKKGTYTYMAPEVYKEESYGSNVDIYSLGIVLYRLLNNNRAPFLPQPPAPITMALRDAALVKRLSGTQLLLPVNAQGRLGEIVLKACAYNPKDRYFSPATMRQDLEAIYCPGASPVIVDDEATVVQDFSVHSVKPELKSENQVEAEENTFYQQAENGKKDSVPDKKRKKLWPVAVIAIALIVAAALFLLKPAKEESLQPAMNSTPAQVQVNSEVNNTVVPSAAPSMTPAVPKVEQTAGNTVVASGELPYSSVKLTVIDDRNIRIELTDDRIPYAYTISTTPGQINPWWGVIVDFGFDTSVHFNIQEYSGTAAWDRMERDTLLFLNGEEISQHNAFDYSVDGNTLIYEIKLPSEIEHSAYDIQQIRVNHSTEKDDYTEGYDVRCKFSKESVEAEAERGTELRVLDYRITEGFEISNISCSVENGNTTISFEYVNNDVVTQTQVASFKSSDFSRANINSNKYVIDIWNNERAPSNIPQTLVKNAIPYGSDNDWYVLLFGLDKNGELCAEIVMKLGYQGYSDELPTEPTPESINKETSSTDSNTEMLPAEPEPETTNKETSSAGSNTGIPPRGNSPIPSGYANYEEVQVGDYLYVFTDKVDDVYRSEDNSTIYYPWSYYYPQT